MPNTEPESVNLRAMAKTTRVHVVAGIIFNPERTRVLIAKRSEGSHQGGLWEFPGGKVAKDEAIYLALCRELSEELAIGVTAASPLFTEDHDYPDKEIRLDIWTVESFTGIARGNEGQEIAWVALQELTGFQFPAANKSILAHLCGNNL